MGDVRVGELTGSPIDMGFLSQNTAGDRKLGREVLHIFKEQSNQYLAALETAETDRAWLDAAHTLKGAARAIGARRVALLAEQAEQISDTQSKRDALAGLRKAVQEARRFIDFQLLDSAH